VYASLLLLLISFIVWVFKKQATIGKFMAIVLVIFLLGISAFSQFGYVKNLSRSGFKFASPNWYAAESIEYLRALPEGTIVYTNEAGVVYLYAGRPAKVIPKTEEGIQAMRRKVRRGRAVIALFRVNDVDEETFLFYYMVLGRNLVREDFSRDWIFVSPRKRR
jgi:hypothetical protein